ncbi:MAG TPA: hypothetical protein PLS68_01860 [Actinotalea sp.]|nr:hypothetical protein [Actinotalea sp.]
MSIALMLLVGAAALLLSGLGGWPLTAGVLRVAARSEDSGDQPGRATGDAADPATDDTADRGPDDTADRGPDDTADPGPDDAADPGPGGTLSRGPGEAAPRDIADLLGAADGEAAPPPRTALRGGTWIGILERLAITATLLAGYPSGIAFVVAVKGLGRYPELRDHPDVSERFVIGTLASMLWAAAVGAGARALLGS